MLRWGMRRFLSSVPLPLLPSTFLPRGRSALIKLASIRRPLPVSCIPGHNSSPINCKPEVPRRRTQDPQGHADVTTILR